MSATIAQKYVSNPLVSWDGTQKIPVDSAGADAVGLASTLKTYCSNAPTLVSAALGIPVSGTLIACVGLPLYTPLSKSADYPTALADAGSLILHPVADNNPRTFTIVGATAYAVGTQIVFVNEINTLSIAISTDTMHLAGGASTGTRSLAAYGIATAVKFAAGLWIISGTNLT